MADFSLSILNPQAKQAFSNMLLYAKENNLSELNVWNLIAQLWTVHSEDTNGLAVRFFEEGLNADNWGLNVLEKLKSTAKKSGNAGTTPPADGTLTLILAALSKEHDKKSQPIDCDAIWLTLLQQKEVADHFNQYGLTLDTQKKILTEKGVSAKDLEEKTFIGQYCQDLTAQAANGELDPVIGRDDETREIMNILQRRTQNNPILVGETGVGKTAMINGLAQRMVNNEVPETLKNKTLLSLDVGSIIAGARYKGELEERVKGLVKEIQERSDIVLFIDEIHTIVNSSGLAGGIGDLLKPALARGEIRCIGATTTDEFRQYIEKDPALERRFQRVNVAEPSVEDAIAILRGIKDRYALHHGVDITDSAIVSAVTLSARYMADRQLPEKAINLMDTAAARVRTVLDSKPENVDRLERRLMQLKAQQETIRREEINKGSLDEDTYKRLLALESEIAKVEQSVKSVEVKWAFEKEKHNNVLAVQEKISEQKVLLEKAVRAQDLTAMSEIQYGVLPKLDKELKEAKKELKTIDEPMMSDQVDMEEIAEIVSRRTGIPVNKMQGGEQQKLADMETTMGKQVIGQPDAVEAVSDAVRRARSGLSDPNKPIGSFLFLGPTGVGKTELTKVLSQFLFDKKDAMVRIDMSEFMEKHAVSRLIGAPPGYVGYEEGGLLTEAIRQKPYSVVLLDEVEKAHPDVFNILLQVLDDGHLTDSQGRQVDFKNTVIIMTSNLGAGEIQEMTANGESQEEIKEAVMDQVKRFFRPEFINRLDETVLFKPLDRPAIHQIARIQLNTVVKRLAEQRKISAVISEAALDHLAEAGFDPLMGARPLKRAIQQELENPLAKEIVSGKILSGDHLSVDAMGGQLKWVATRPEISEEEDLLTETEVVPVLSADLVKEKQQEKPKTKKSPAAPKKKS